MVKPKGLMFIVLIALLTVMFVGFAADTWYPEPQYDDFCDVAEPNRLLEPGPIRVDEECGGEWRVAMEEYSRNIAAIFILIGAGLIIYGTKYAKLVNFTTVGLMWGGTLVIMYGVIRYWGFIESQFKPIILLALLIGVVTFGNKYKNFLK